MGFDPITGEETDDYGDGIMADPEAAASLPNPMDTSGLGSGGTVSEIIELMRLSQQDSKAKALAALESSNEPFKYTPEQSVGAATIGLLPLLLGALGGKKGLYSGAIGGLTGVTGFDKTAKENYDKNQKRKEAEAKIYSSSSSDALNKIFNLQSQSALMKQRAELAPKRNLEGDQPTKEGTKEMIREGMRLTGISEETVKDTDLDNKREVDMALSTIKMIQDAKGEERRQAEQAAGMLGSKLKPMSERAAEKLGEYRMIRERLMDDLQRLNAIGDPNLAWAEFQKMYPNSELAQAQKYLNMDARFARSAWESGVATEPDIQAFVDQLSPSTFEYVGNARKRLASFIKAMDGAIFAGLAAKKASGFNTIGLEGLLGIQIPDYLAGTPQRTAFTTKSATEALSSGAATNRLGPKNLSAPPSAVSQGTKFGTDGKQYNVWLDSSGKAIGYVD